MKTDMYKDKSICATALHLDGNYIKRLDLIMKSWTLENKASFSSTDASSIPNNNQLTPKCTIPTPLVLNASPDVTTP